MREKTTQAVSNLKPEEKKNIDLIGKMFSANISFWGKAVDENGKPIEDAKVIFGAADKYFGKGTNYTGKSDSQGLFSISGISGAGLYVRVEKEGYYHISGKSNGSFAYGVPSGQERPTKDNPAIFVLKKKGLTEPMINFSFDKKDLPHDGSSIEIELKSGKTVPIGQGDIRVSSKIEKIAWNDNRTKFDWEIKIEILNGGLVDRKNTLDFIAPENGYESSWKIQVSKTDDDSRSRHNLQRDVFLKLRNGKYARVELRVNPFSTPFEKINNVYSYSYRFVGLYGDVYLNPSGSRNLEYDPAKRLKWDKVQQMYVLPK